MELSKWNGVILFKPARPLTKKHPSIITWYPWVNVYRGMSFTALKKRDTEQHDSTLLNRCYNTPTAEVRRIINHSSLHRKCLHWI